MLYLYLYYYISSRTVGGLGRGYRIGQDLCQLFPQYSGEGFMRDLRCGVKPDCLFAGILVGTFLFTYRLVSGSSLGTTPNFVPVRAFD